MTVRPTLSFEPLSPVNLLARSGEVFSDREAVIDGDDRVTYGELWQRCQRLAGGLNHLGVRPGDRVAVLAYNSHLLLEAHFGIPLAGAVVVPLNTRLKVGELAEIIRHSGAQVILHDAAFEETCAAVAAVLDDDLRCVSGGGQDSPYEAMVRDSDAFRHPISDELSLLAVNYTSGTTGRPKGVMYHHRGAYLQGLAMALHFGLGSDSVFLWTLPMFHCNGWCFPYAVTAAGARHVCLDKITPTKVWEQIAAHDVTHLDAAPTVLIDLAHHAPADRATTAAKIRIGTGGAPPSPALLSRLDDLNVDVTHLYGMTETFGPSVICEWRSEWDDLPQEERASRKARQGVSNVVAGPIRVIDDRGADVPRDADTVGELVIRGNTVMTGYLHDPEATAAAAPDGWLRTGDLAVRHPDGYVEIRDRAKDVIISGGENISSVEVEQVLATHPAVLEVAVVAGPHDRWGEVPVAFVEVRSGASVSEDELIDHVRERIAHFKAPKRVEFGPLPRTSTGKIQKYVLRQQGDRGRGGSG